VFARVLCGSENKQQLFHYTALTDWFLGVFAELQKAAVVFVMSAPTGRIFMKFDISVFFEKRLRWSRGSVLAFGTQVRGFKPGRSRRIFRAEKSSTRLPSEGN
jgi:hypothetical protein